MPTFTAIALETLLEPRIRDSSAKNVSDSKQQHAIRPVIGGSKEEEEDVKEKKTKPPVANQIFIKPALYITPEQTPIPDSSSFDSLSPSPYVVNHKRRGGHVATRRIGGLQILEQQQSPDGETNSDLNLNLEGDENENGGESHVEDVVVGDFPVEEVNGKEKEGYVVEEDDFADPRCDSFSVASSEGMNEFGRQVDNQSLMSNQGEFFDVDDDFSSDGSTSNIPSCGPSVELELHATKLSLLEEIKRRKIAENAISLMHGQWQRISCLLSQDGLSIPTSSNSSGNMQLDISSIEQLSQEVVVARFVAEATGRGLAHAEAELAAEAIIELKDQEISRLQDRLQYYEVVNREMCQRNQEVMEVARRQRQRKRIQRRWLWSIMSLSTVIGASMIAYSYLPQTSKFTSSSTSSVSPDSSGIVSLEHA